jgi:hypothetical protein
MGMCHSATAKDSAPTAYTPSNRSFPNKTDRGDTHARARRIAPPELPPHKALSELSRAPVFRGLLSLDIFRVLQWSPGPWALRLLGRQDALARNYSVLIVVAIGERRFASKSVAVLECAEEGDVHVIAPTARQQAGSAGARIPVSTANINQVCRVWITEDDKVASITLYAEKRVLRAAVDKDVPGLVPVAQGSIDLAGMFASSPKLLLLYDVYPGLLRMPGFAGGATSSRNSSNRGVSRPLLTAASNAAAESSRVRKAASEVKSAFSRSEPAIPPATSDTDGSCFVSIDAACRSYPGGAVPAVENAAAAAVAAVVGGICFSAAVSTTTSLQTLVLADLCREVDSDGDGKLTPAEFLHVLDMLGIPKSSSPALLAVADPSGTGCLGYAGVALSLSGGDILSAPYARALLGR